LAAGLELRLDAGGRLPAEGTSEPVASATIVASGHAVADLLVRSGAALSYGDGLSGRLRELYARLGLGPAFATIGRSVVNYGRCSALSPVDIYSDYDRTGPIALRLGTDALRVGTAFGATGMLEAIAGFPSGVGEAGSGRYSLRASGLVGGIDGGLVGAWDGDTGAWLAGADFKADLGAGIYGEALCSLEAGRDARFRAALGADWSVRLGVEGGRLVARAEYCYDGMPYPEPRGAPDAHNAYASLSWAGDRAMATAQASLSLPGEAASAAFLGSLDAAPGASLSAYARATFLAGRAGPALEAGTALEIAF